MVIWQDIVITFANILFSLSLIPQVYHGFRKKKSEIVLLASIPTFTGLYVLAFTFLTLDLIFSSAMSFITGTMWFILFIQRLRYN